VPKSYEIYTIDLKKAADTAHAEYYFRLMMYYNDLASHHKLSEMIWKQEKDLPPVVFSGLESYTTKIETSHICEAANAFILKIMPLKSATPEHAIYDTIRKLGPPVKPQYEALQDMLLVRDSSGNFILNAGQNGHEKTDSYKKLLKVRNNWGFHYNHDNEGELTAKAVAEYLDEHLKTMGTECVCKAVDVKKSIFRFPLADEIVNAASMLASEVPLATKDADLLTEPHFMIVREFRTGLALALKNFAEAMIDDWIAKENLVITAS
jgi:hypothetical protein